MGGLRAKMPLTFWTFLIATVALSGRAADLRIPQQGRNTGRSAGVRRFLPAGPFPAAVDRVCRGRIDGLLHVPADFPHVLRKAARESPLSKTPTNPLA